MCTQFSQNMYIILYLEFMTFLSLGGAEGQNKILNQDQMAEISRMLAHVKGQGQGQSDLDNPQIAELIEMLKHMQSSQPGEQKKSHKQSPKPGHGRGDKHKGLVGVKRTVQFQPAKVNKMFESSTATVQI